jgi:hypothetical protein
LLSENIERAFDAYEISFVKHPLTQSLTMKFWRPDSPWQTKPLYTGSTRTIGVFEGRVLDLTFRDRAGFHTPFLRGLAYQAFQAHVKWRYIPSCRKLHFDFTSDDSLSVFNKERMVYLQFKAIADAEQAEQSAEEDAEDYVSIGCGDRHGSDNNSDEDEDEDEDEEEGWQDRSSAQTEQPEGLATTSTVRGEELVVVTDSNADKESNNKRQRNV